MINGNPLFTGTSEDTQLDTIFRHLGTPDESTFPGISELPDWRSDFPNYPPPDSLHVLVPNLEQSGVELLQVSECQSYHKNHTVSCQLANSDSRECHLSLFYYAVHTLPCNYVY